MARRPPPSRGGEAAGTIDAARGCCKVEGPVEFCRSVGARAWAAPAAGAGGRGASAPAGGQAHARNVEHHGISHTDDYAWLQTENLEGVLQRPEALDDPIRRHLEAEGHMPAPCWRPIASSSAGWWRRCGGASAGATRRCRSGGGRGNTTPATRSARSASCTAGGRATAGPSRCCSTRTRWRAAGEPSRWRKPPSARTTSSLPTRSTRTVRSATRSRSAT